MAKLAIHESPAPGSELAVGDRVLSTARPEWGLGRVASSPSAGKVSVLFREGGARTLALAFAKLERIGDGERTDGWLELLSLEPVSAAAHVSPAQAAARFLARHPDGFREEGYLRRERGPFEAAREIVRGALSREALRSAQRSRRWEPVCRSALEALAMAKLVPAADVTLLRRALEASSARRCFGSALVDLLHGRRAPEERVAAFATALRELDAGRWSLATFFAFARAPDQHLLLRPGETPAAAAALRFDLEYRPEVNPATYARLLRLGHALAEEIAVLEPADLFDVYSILRSIAAPVRAGDDAGR
jgi:hypothetical protein